MCTVSWSFRDKGYDLFFNRDELNSRAPESAPALVRKNDVTFIAPRDGNHGGTWLLVNEWGLTVCLLNDYGNTWIPAGSASRFSRGNVVLACAAATSLQGVANAVETLPLERTPPFHLVALMPEKPPLVLQWDGLKLTSCADRKLIPPLTSSSYATKEVVARRIDRFSSLVVSPFRPDPVELAAYHHQHARESGADSVLMNRLDAATRSIIHIKVEPDLVRVDYGPVRWSAEGPVLLAPVQSTLSRRMSTPQAA